MANTWQSSTEKFLRPSACACLMTTAVGGGVVSKPMAKKTTSRSAARRPDSRGRESCAHWTAAGHSPRNARGSARCSRQGIADVGLSADAPVACRVGPSQAAASAVRPLGAHCCRDGLVWLQERGTVRAQAPATSASDQLPSPNSANSARVFSASSGSSRVSA